MDIHLLIVFSISGEEMLINHHLQMCNIGFDGLFFFRLKEISFFLILNRFKHCQIVFCHLNMY